MTTFIDHWQTQLPAAYIQFAQLATEAPEIDLNSLIAAAILWPAGAPGIGGGTGIPVACLVRYILP